MGIFRKPYEISLWEDRLTLVDSDFNEYQGFVPSNTSIIGSYYKETKICIIGSDEMDAPICAMEPKLTRKIDGSNQLTFSIYSYYYDENEETLVKNPFLPYLANERKVKLKYQEKGQVKWLDFIIKQISETSEKYLYTYVATDYFVNELSKSGLSLVFDLEKENNQGNVNELGNRILEGTDWRIGEDTELIKQTQEEALYEIVLRKPIEAFNTLTGDLIKIAAGEKIYAFYTSITNKEDFFQFVYNKNNIYQLDENRLIINSNEYWTKVESAQSEFWPDFAETVTYTSKMRGLRHVRSPKTLYDKVLDKYVAAYKSLDGKKYRGYTETKYISPNLIRSYITGGYTFSGWSQKKVGTLKTTSIPSYVDYKVDQYKGVRVPTAQYYQEDGNYLFNSGLNDNAFYLEDILKDEWHRFRIKCGLLNKAKTKVENTPLSYNLKCRSYTYKANGDIADQSADDIVLFEATINNNAPRDSEGYVFGDFQAKVSVTQQQLKELKFGIFITVVNAPLDENNNVLPLYLVGAQLFKIRRDANNNIAYPEGKVVKKINNQDIIETDFQEKTEVVYYYYPEGEYNKPEDITYTYIGEENKNFMPIYDDTYEKIRSITAQGTNRFNLLQQLSETFECWCKINVEHKENGELKLEKDLYHFLTIESDSVNGTEEMAIDAEEVKESSSLVYDSVHFSFEEAYRPRKFITFHKNVGQLNHADFVAGINLKNISRNLETDNFITKLIVKNNNNKFAKSGSCNIARATENPINDNFLINFDYYINMGLLNYDNFYNDMYSMTNGRGWLGYYTRLKALNTRLLEITEEWAALSAKVSQYESDYEIASEQYDSTSKTLKDNENLFYQKTGFTIDEFTSDMTWSNEEDISALAETIFQLRAQNEKLHENYIFAQKKSDKLSASINKLEQEQKDLLVQKEKINAAFEKKYARFIQEAPWSSEDYTDDNLYYLDANSTLHNSAQPKVSYTINVTDLSLQEEYENYAYGLGDITHIQDPEFFGYVYIEKNGEQIRTPYREKIVVTETVTNFNSPEKDVIKVQNFRSQFEDLFQRMAATTQKVEFYAGAYEKAADVVESGGQISTESLRDAFSNNAYILKNANNESVLWDKKGITTTNQNAPNEIVRIVGGGLFVTEDGGKTWSTGITGRGINAKTITTGQLNTGLITIMDDSQPAFRWDKSGISAYKKESNGIYNNRVFVRYDQYGLYGIDNTEAPSSLNEIWEKAKFALTWKGFKLRTGNEKGSVEISTDEDFLVRNAEGNVAIQIGRIIDNSGNEVYGMTIGETFKATPDTLKIGGWNVEPGAFTGESELYKVGLYSNPEVNKNQYFIAAGLKDSFNDSSVFYVKHNGELHATAGEIAGWELSKTGFSYFGEQKEELDIPIFYLGTGTHVHLPEVEGDESVRGPLMFKAGDNFGITHSGEIYAYQGYIGGWKLDENSLSSIIDENKFYLGTVQNDKGYILQIGEKFGVKKNGNINATGGTLGGWEVESGKFWTTGLTLNSYTKPTAPIFSTDVITQDSLFSVYYRQEWKNKVDLNNATIFVDYIFPDSDQSKIDSSYYCTVSLISFQGNQVSKVDVSLQDDRILRDENTGKYYITITISFEGAATSSDILIVNYSIGLHGNQKTKKSACSILGNGHIQFASGSLGNWSIQEDGLVGSRIQDETTSYQEPKITSLGLELRTYQTSSESESPSIRFISWGELFNLLDKISKKI